MRLQRGPGNRAVTELLHGSAGRPLDKGTREEMEGRFGRSFSDVRIHSGPAGNRAALKSGARAVTAGLDIAFGDGFYRPGSTGGRRLIAHELAHVLQQRDSGGRTSSAASAEAEARQAGAQVAGGGNPAVHASASGVQADPMTKEEIQQAIADNEAKAEKATAQDEIQKLFDERNDLYDRLNAPEQIQVPGGPPPPWVATREKPKPVRTDYEAAENAYSGIELEYTARGDLPTKEIYSPGVYKSKRYWLAPHMRSETDKVVYYIAYNPATKRNEFAVGPDQVQEFLSHEDLYWYTAAGAYPIAGDMPDYKAKSGRMVAKMMQGKYGDAFDAWKDSWKAAVKDPQFWVESVTATTALAAGPTATEGTELANAADELPKNGPSTPAPEAPVSTPVPEELPAPPTGAATAAVKPTPTAATNVDQVFAELDSELQCVPEAGGPLQGTAQGGFESPQPLTPGATTSPIRTPGGVAVRESTGASPRPSGFQSASAQTSRSMNTAIRADIGEAEAYKAALERGEIGIQRPGGANVPGADFITAAEGPQGMEIIVNDAKTSSVGKFPSPKGPGVKPTWQAEVDDAIQPGRLDLGDPVLEQRIRDAAQAGRVRVRQVNADYSPAGQGDLSGY